MYSLGIDLGSYSVKIALLAENGAPVLTEEYPHRGAVLRALREAGQTLASRNLLTGVARAGVTGTGAALLADAGHSLNRTDAVPALHAGARLLCPQAVSLIEIGAQNARYLTDMRSGAPRFAMNEDCAGGTGAFFEDQVYRLKLTMDDYSRIAGQARSIPRLSGKCSVFAKTDIIHHQQEGAPVADILLGLCYAVVRNYKMTITRRLPMAPPMALCGGVVKNAGVVRAVREIFKLGEEELFADAGLVFTQAVGAAALARAGDRPFDASAVLRFLETGAASMGAVRTGTRHAPLTLEPGTCLAEPEAHFPQTPFDCALGIDVGSTSTNLALVKPDGGLAAYLYLRTEGDPRQAVRGGLAALERESGGLARVTAVGVTGSGRHMIGKMVGADTVVDEITAQARGAVQCDPDADTVFEIGGQDSKFISLRNGAVADFQMNRICAAGTGSFIEEQAERMGVNDCRDIGPMALRATEPADLGERCTVFMGSQVTSLLANGVSEHDVLAGLCHAAVDNYLHKVVGNKNVGDRIVLQGGVAYNAGIVAAFQQRFGSRIRVSPLFPISGAVGAAMLAARECRAETAFKGFTAANGGETARVEIDETAAANTAVYQERRNRLWEGYDGAVDPEKKTIGIPLALLVYKFLPMISGFFRNLGYNTLVSTETNADTVALSQHYAKADQCYPVKLIHGHMMELVERGVDYILMPRIQTMPHKGADVHCSYGCVYMQTAPVLAARSLELERRGIPLLSPRFFLDSGPSGMASALVETGRSLGKSAEECAAAMTATLMAIQRRHKQREARDANPLSGFGPEEKVLVLITRAYGIADPVLNMGIPEILLRHGYKVMTLSDLPAHGMDLSAEYPNLYWAFGQHILSGARLVRTHPNLYAVYITNHGCGPDSMLAHLFAEEMGDKPYLQLEVDEHFSQVGVETRIEAFLNSLKTRANPPQRVAARPDIPAFSAIRAEDAGGTPPAPPKSAIRATADKKSPLYLPPLWPYSELAAAMLRRRGFDARALPASTADSLALGRKEAVSKEYLSFTAVVGSLLRHAGTAEPGAQYCIPSTEGAETDGQYGRCGRTVLDRHGYESLAIVSPMLETAPGEAAFFEELFPTLLAGDLIWAAPPAARAELAAQCLRDIDAGDFSAGNAALLAKKVAALHAARGSRPGRKVFVVGEPACLFDAMLNHRLLDRSETQDICLVRMPLAEYCWFLWKDRGQSATATAAMAFCEDRMAGVREILGEAGPFSPDREALFAAADKDLPCFAGGNGRYRHAKCAQLLAAGRAVIMANSLHENTGDILGVLRPETVRNLLELAFDDTTGIVAEGRLFSFLHYLNAPGPMETGGPDQRQWADRRAI